MPEDNKYFHYYNSNPKNKHEKDCTYRALSLFLGISWEDAARLDAEFFLKYGMWLYSTELEGCFYHSRINLLMEERGYKQVYPCDSGKNIATLRDFINSYALPDKVYLCELNGHMVAIKEGKVWDTWDSSDCCPLTIFEN